MKLETTRDMQMRNGERPSAAWRQLTSASPTVNTEPFINVNGNYSLYVKFLAMMDTHIDYMDTGAVRQIQNILGLLDLLYTLLVAQRSLSM